MASTAMDPKEEIINKKMEMMRRKNEILIKRHQEIEADKRNAELLSKGIGPQDNQGAGDRKGLSPTILASSGRGKKLQEFASHQLKADEMERILDPIRRQAANTNAHGYGQSKGKIDMTMSMTGRQRREYEEWRSERERIDGERINRHKNSTGGWRREWDADKIEQGEREYKPSSVTRSNSWNQRGGSRIGSGRFPSHNESNSPPQKIGECWDDSVIIQRSDNREKIDRPRRPDFKDNLNPRRNEQPWVNRHESNNNYRKNDQSWDNQRKNEHQWDNHQRRNEQPWDNQRKNDSSQDNPRQSDGCWDRLRQNDSKDKSDSPKRPENFRRNDSWEKSDSPRRPNFRDNVRRSESWDKSDNVHWSDDIDQSFRGGRGGKFNRSTGGSRVFITNKEPQKFENVFQDGEEKELNKELENAPISNEQKVLQKQDLLIISITNDLAAGGEIQLRKDKVNIRNKDNHKNSAGDKETIVKKYEKSEPPKMFNRDNKYSGKQGSLRISPIPDKPNPDSPKTIHSPEPSFPVLTSTPDITTAAIALLSEEGNKTEVALSDSIFELKVEEDWDTGGDDSWEDCTSGSLELSGQSLSQHSEDVSASTKDQLLICNDSIITPLIPTAPEFLESMGHESVLDSKPVVENKEIKDQSKSLHSLDNSIEDVLLSLNSTIDSEVHTSTCLSVRSNLDAVDVDSCFESSLDEVEIENQELEDQSPAVENDYEISLNINEHDDLLNCSESSTHSDNREDSPEAENNDNSEASDTESVTEPTLAA